ncbi:DUF6519 domain-containing protein [uncultured Desulfobacter sp.]|uniref:DUF6519 domain-containing protein n=1 Tax=uncultured Desulfobacter sp. TaxID=240139 RepID=UPI003747DBF7
MKGDFSRLTFNPNKQYSGVLFQQGKVQLDADLNELQAIKQYREEVEAGDVIGKYGRPKNDGGFEIGLTPDRTDLTISCGRIYVDGHLCQSELFSFKVLQKAFTANNEFLMLPIEPFNKGELKKGQWLEIFSGIDVSNVVKVIDIHNTTVTFEPPLSSKETDRFPTIKTAILIRRIFTFFNQPYLNPDDLPKISAEVELEKERYLVYLDVWERYVTHLDDAQIRETALGGIDTTGRSKTIWQVALLPVNADAQCAHFGEAWSPADKPYGQLNVQTAPVPETTNNCMLPMQAGYQGLENRLYRVEIHQGGDLGYGDTISFKWSRDNGSTVIQVHKIEESTLFVDTTGPDYESSFTIGQWTELTDDLHEFNRLPGHLSRIIDATRSNTITLSSAPPETMNLAGNMKLRRWDCAGEQTIKAAMGPEDWITLENDIQINFSKGHYTTGDYWMIPARSVMQSENGTIEWPQDDDENPLAQYAQGVHHRYAPLAIVDFDYTKRTFELIEQKDCCPIFPSLTSITAEDVGYKSTECPLPNAATVKDAIDYLCNLYKGPCELRLTPEPGWENKLAQIKEGDDVHICFRTGTYSLQNTVILKNMGHIKITGNGFGTQIIVQNSETAIKLEDCKSVFIQDLSALSIVTGNTGNDNGLNGTFSLVNCMDIAVENLSIQCGAGTSKAATCLTIRNDISGISLAGGKGSVRIEHCNLHIGHMQIGMLLVNVARAVIEDNYLTVPAKPKRYSFEYVNKNKIYRSKVRSLLINNAEIHTIKEAEKTSAKSDQTSKKNASVQLGNFKAYFNTDPKLTLEWQNIVKANPPSENEIINTGDFFKYLNRLADQMILNQGQIRGSVKVTEWYKTLKNQNPAVAAQGIVIGGQEAVDIRVKNNTLCGVSEGIHVGLRHRSMAQGKYDDVDRLVITNNTIDLRFPPLSFKERYGIFVGNSKSAIIENNFIRVTRFSSTTSKHIEGIRIFGYLGPMMILRSNHLENFTIGIYVNPLNDIPQSLVQWVATNNISPKAKFALEIGARAKQNEAENEATERNERNGALKEKFQQDNNFS